MLKKRKPIRDDEYDNEDTDSDVEHDNRILSFITQPVIFPLIITALFYIIVANYYISFFNRLSLPFFSLNLPLTFYLNSGFLIISFIMFASIIFILIYNTYLMRKFGLISGRRRLISIFMIILAFIITQFFVYVDIFNKGFPIIILSVVLTVSFLAIMLKSVTKEEKLPTRAYMIIAVILFCLVIILPPSLGLYSADCLIKGNSDNFEVQLSLKDKNISIPNNTFILVSQSNGNYYLVEKMDQMPELVKLYVIPESNIKMISIIYHPNSIMNTNKRIVKSYLDDFVNKIMYQNKDLAYQFNKLESYLDKIQ
jgi:hypothetical protein